MHGIQPTKFNLKDDNGEYAVEHQSNYGAEFGNYDIVIYPNCNTNTNSYANFPYAYNDTTGNRKRIFQVTQAIITSEYKRSKYSE